MGHQRNPLRDGQSTEKTSRQRRKKDRGRKRERERGRQKEGGADEEMARERSVDDKSEGLRE